MMSLRAGWCAGYDNKQLKFAAFVKSPTVAASSVHQFLWWSVTHAHRVGKCCILSWRIAWNSLSTLFPTFECARPVDRAAPTLYSLMRATPYAWRRIVSTCKRYKFYVHKCVNIYVLFIYSHKDEMDYTWLRYVQQVVLVNNFYTKWKHVYANY